MTTLDPSRPNVADLREIDHNTRAAIPDDVLDNLANENTPGAMTEQPLRECLKKTGIRRASVTPACAPKAAMHRVEATAVAPTAAHVTGAA